MSTLYTQFDSPTAPPTEEMRKTTEYAGKTGVQLIIETGVNSHYVARESSDHNFRGMALFDNFNFKNLLTTNKNNTPTFILRRRKEILDITICIQAKYRLGRCY